jgi:hypothetical protein
MPDLQGRVYAINLRFNDNYRTNPPSPTINLQIVFIAGLVKKKYVGYWWGWAGLYGG